MKSLKIKLLLTINLTATLVLCISVFKKYEHIDFSNRVLKVKGLVVTDSSGVERVIIGSPLPHATMHGYRMYRGDYGSISGIMLYDSEGQERGGYVTDDGYGNIYLTLDSKTQQTALFIGDPIDGSALQLWGRNGNKISLSAGNEDIYIDLKKNNREIKIETDEK